MFAPEALAIASELSVSIFLWAGIAVLHLVKIAITFEGVEAELISIITKIEDVSWIASFAMVPIHLILRAFRSVKEDLG